MTDAEIPLRHENLAIVPIPYVWSTRLYLSMEEQEHAEINVPLVYYELHRTL